MITRFKIFEELNEGDPEKGDNVICEYKEPNIPDRILNKPNAIENINNFLSNNIGVIIRTGDKDEKHRGYHVLYTQHIPYNLLTYGFFDYTRHNYSSASFRYDEIIFYSKDKYDVEAHIAAEKYNII